jgi:hypothetical protein
MIAHLSALKNQERVSGLMIDRKVPHVPGGIDIHVEPSPIDYEKSAAIVWASHLHFRREQVEVAKERS